MARTSTPSRTSTRRSPTRAGRSSAVSSSSRTTRRGTSASLPNLVVIGAAKSGTTSLHAYLDAHPEISMSRPKELQFFLRDDCETERARRWYARQFAESAPVRGESTPGYTLYPYFRGVPERMSNLIGDAKLVYVVRDPVDRLASMYVQRWSDGDRRPFAAWVERRDEPENYVVCGSRYGTQLERYLGRFDRAQIHVVDQRDLKDRREETLAGVFAFLGVDPGFRSDTFALEQNTRADKQAIVPATAGLTRRVLWPLARHVPPRIRRPLGAPVKRRLYQPVPASTTPRIEGATRAALEEHLRPDIARFRELTGLAFEHWSV